MRSHRTSFYNSILKGQEEATVLSHIHNAEQNFLFRWRTFWHCPLVSHCFVPNKCISSECSVGVGWGGLNKGSMLGNPVLESLNRQVFIPV